VSDRQAVDATSGASCQCLAFLVSILKDPQQLDALRLAALVGIERHCGAGIADTNFRDSEVIPLLVQLASDKNVPEGKDPKVHEWLRVRAIDVIAITGQAGPNGQNIQMLLSFVTDDKESPKVRLAAARALGSFDYSQVQGVNLLTIRRAWARWCSIFVWLIFKRCLRLAIGRNWKRDYSRSMSARPNRACAASGQHLR